MLIPLLENFLTLLCAFFAFRSGNMPERIGAGWLAGNTCVGLLLFLLGLSSPTWHLIFDGLFAIGFLPLAMIFVSYWIGLVTLIAAALFTLEALYLLNDRSVDLLYIWINNGLWLSIPLVFLAAGVTSLLRRRRAEREERLEGDVAAAC